MIFRWRWLWVFCALVLGGGEVFAATREERAYATASTDFQSEMWSRAETGFAQFALNYPKSTNAPMAVLLSAQAQFKQAKFPAAIKSLTAAQAKAGSLADQYAVWIAEAQFAGKNFADAAESFAALTKNFPDSPLRLRAAVEAAAAYEKLGDWTKLSSLLGDTNGVFARKADLDAANELVARGRLLLAQAEFEQKNYPAASVQLSLVNSLALKPELDWQRVYLLCRTKLAAGEFAEAFAAGTNLIAIAQVEKNETHRAEGVVLRAEILERLGRAGEAIAVWQENLAAASSEKQRQAVLKIAELSIGQGQFMDADGRLENFLKQFPDSAAADIALLTRGELRLKNYSSSTNADDLAAAHEQFDQLLKKFPNSPLAGKALLGRGWSVSLPDKFGEGLEDFRRAAQKNLAPEDLAVARFKTGDALFARKDFHGALENYSAVLNDFTATPSVENELGGLALYQSLRAELELGDPTAAGAIFGKLFPKFASGSLGQGGALLYGESLFHPAEARALFEKLAPAFSGGPLEPQLKLAIARAFELEQNWPAALQGYTDWRRDFPTNSLRPQADYALAQVNFHAGNEAVALALFTEFVAQQPKDVNAPLAQWWIADHYFRAGNFVGAETNYEAVYQNPAWKSSPLFFEAQLMAGRSAYGRTSFKEAAAYFTALITDTNCPDEVGLKARFAAGAALMHMESADTNATLANLQSATNLLSQIIQKNQTNEIAARALGSLADCAVQMGELAVATNAYARAAGTNLTQDVTVRSRAQVGLGLALEKMATQATGSDRTNLLNLALDHYRAVFDGDNLGDNQVQDLWWTKKAGLLAAPLVGVLNNYQTQTNFYAQLKMKLPQLAAQVDKKVAALSPEKN
jgi:outer membrane protein assembly factor BamD (BamD/ComL family)